MAKQVRPKAEILELAFRAVCENGDFKGSWRDNEDDAYAEADAHQSKPGNQEHIIHVERRETSRMRFMRISK